jgi:uncharacterized membrane protein YfcA
MHAISILGTILSVDVHPAWVLVAFAVTLIGVTKSGFGAGMGLIVVPLTAIGLSYLPPTEKAALGLLLPLLIAGDVLALFQYRKLLDVNLLRKLAIPTMLGVVIGGLLLLGLHRLSDRSEPLAGALIRLEIGLESVVLVSIHYYTRWRGEGGKLMAEPLRSWLAGSYSAVSSTLAHAAGPVIGLYLLPLKLPRQAFVGTCAAYFFALNTMKLPAYYAAGQFGYVSWRFTAAFLPLVLLGAGIGRLMVRHMTDRVFSQVVYAGTFLIGWYLILDAGWKLVGV